MTRTALSLVALLLVAGGAGAFARSGRPAPAPAAAGAGMLVAPEAGGGSIAVWIQPRSRLAGWRADDVVQVERAFAAWNGIVSAVDFYFTDDSANAAVRVGWRDRFSRPMTGWSRVVRDRSGRVVEASVTLAVRHPGGEPVAGDAMRALATHEVGHLLGLGHSSDPRSIMSPVVHVRSLSAGDSAALRQRVAAEGRE